MMNTRRMNLVALALCVMFIAACTSDSSDGNRTAVPTPGGDRKAGQASPRTITGEEGRRLMVVATLDGAVTDTLKALTAGKGKEYKVERSGIAAEQLKVLDEFAAKSTGASQCETLSVEGCNSCCADGISSSLRHTTCGDFCDKVCGAEPCH
jgi:hypothetical protein